MQRNGEACLCDRLMGDAEGLANAVKARASAEEASFHWVRNRKLASWRR